MPLHSVETVADQSLLGLWRLTESAEQLWPLLPQPAHYQQHLPPGRDAARAQQWLGGRVLAHQLLAEFSFAPSVVLLNDANGRPFFPEQPELAVSLSHSGEWVAALLSTRGRVGTDVELVRSKAQQLAPRFLSETEQADAGDDVVKHSLYWSAKETLYKLHSRRALVFKEHIQLDPFGLREAGVLTGHLLTENFRSQHQIHYQRLSSSYVLTYTLDASPLL
ncbi:4'-phosphopantetheinyl transferase superfamily protein [Hymenobacter sp. BT730]|uniref:4'-phosphopantetheinyl transferase superfamily protein n=1 Tax=Hymenobacter sp. BT730 TaxID=3063332 RepID=UPI0026E0F32F|nr:4'-phosphopantetheinyl transferase superfamily protein [Hymenobacter sp. BT730]